MYLNIESPVAFAKRLAEMPRNPNDYWLILLADRHQGQLPALISALNDNQVPFFGGVFPGIIQEHRRYAEGAVVKCLPCIGEPRVVTLENPGNHDLDGLPLPDAIARGKPLLHLFVDCLAPDISGLLLAVFNRYGNKVSYVGGGCGNHVLGDEPNVFVAEGLYRGAAVLALVDEQASTGVRHGWKRIKGPFVATRPRGNVIQELNWEPALDVYKRSLPAERAGESAVGARRKAKAKRPGATEQAFRNAVKGTLPLPRPQPVSIGSGFPGLFTLMFHAW